MKTAPFAVAAGVVLGWCTTGCGSHTAAPGIACIPGGTVAVAFLDLDRLRSSPVYRHLPPMAVAPTESYRSAQHLLIAWNGTDVLIVAEGSFREAPPGATLATRNLALSGAPGAVRAALAQYRSGSTGVPGLLAYASKTAGRSPIWVAVQGGVTLPFTGNAGNLNRLFHNLDYAILSADLAAPVKLDVTAFGRSQQAARDFEENLRAFLSLASAAEGRHQEIAALLDSIQVHRQGAIATASLSVPPEEIEKLVEPFTH